MKLFQEQIATASIEADISRQQFDLSNLRKNIENHLTVILAWVFAVALLSIVVILAFPLSSLAESNALFVNNKVKNAIEFSYIATSIAFVVVALNNEKISAKFMQLMGRIYMIATLLGFAKLGSQIYSEWVAIINLSLGMSFLVSGSFMQDYRQRLLVARLITQQRQPSSLKVMDTVKSRYVNATK